MDEKYIQTLYNSLGGEQKFGKYEDFRDLISNNEDYRKQFHSTFGEKQLGAYNDFNDLVSLKKKDTGTNGSNVSVSDGQSTSKNDAGFNIGKLASGNSSVAINQDDPIGSYQNRLWDERDGLQGQLKQTQTPFAQDATGKANVLPIDATNKKVNDVINTVGQLSENKKQLQQSQDDAKKYIASIPSSEAKDYVQSRVQKDNPNAPDVLDINTDDIRNLPSFKGNVTANMMLDKVDNYKKVLKASDGAIDIEDWARNFAKENDPDLYNVLSKPTSDNQQAHFSASGQLGGTTQSTKKDKPITIGSGITSGKDAATGTSVYQLLSNSAAQEIANNNPELKQQFQNSYDHLFNTYPSFGRKILGEEIGKYREENGMNNIWYNSDNGNDKIVEDMVNKGQLPPTAYDFYKANKSAIHVPTSDIISNLAHGIDVGTKQGLSSISDIWTTGKEATKETTENKYTQQSFTPKGTLHELTTMIPEFTGQILPMALLTKGLGAAGISPRIASAISMGTMFEHSNRQRGAELFPNNTGMQQLYSAASTGVDMLIGAAYDRSKALNFLNKEVKPQISDVLKKLESGEINEVAAQDAIKGTVNTAFDKIKTFGSEALKQNVEQSAQIGSFTLAHDVVDAAFGQKFDLNKSLDKSIASAKNAFISGSALSLLAAAGQTNPAMKVAADQVYDMTKNYDRTKDAINNDTQLSDAQKEERVTNLDHAKLILNDVENNLDLTDKQKKRYLLQSLNEKVLQDKMDNTTDSVLKNKYKEQIKLSQDARENIIGDKNIEQQPKEEAAPESIIPQDEQITNQEGSTENKQADIPTEETSNSETTIPENIQGTTEGEKPKATISQKGEDNGNQPPTEPIIASDSPENTVGIRHESLTDIAKRLGLSEPERGTFLSPEEQSNRGRALINGGADPVEVGEQFKKDGLVGADRISIARAHFEDLTKSMNDVGDKFGTNSDQYKKANEEWLNYRDSVIKPMGTESGAAFSSLQGERNLDTGSFTAIKSAKEEATGKPIKDLPTPIQDLSEMVKKLTAANEELNKRLADAIDRETKSAQTKGSATIKQKAQNIANKLREQAKLHKPDSFSSATPASLAWDGAVEVVAKGIEIGGDVAQAIADGIKHIQNTDWYRGLTESKQRKVEQDFSEWQKGQLSNKENFKKDAESLAERFVGKKDNTFSPEDTKDMWDYAKNAYINDNPNFNVVEMMNKVAMDLGLTPAQVRHALSGKGETKRIADRIYRNQYEKNKAHKTIQRWVNKSKENSVDKLFNTISAPFRGLATLGHGHALLFTHAGLNLFDPIVAKKFMLAVGNQFKLVYGKAENYEMAKNDLRNDPLFTTALRNGLAVDPNTVYDDWQIANNFLKKLKVQGNKGFLVLKMMRMELFKAEYNRLSNIEKADPEALKNVAQIANHWTGTASLGVSAPANALIFAPNLIASKFARLTTDPVKAIITLGNWKDASVADKTAAKIILKKSGRIAATYLLALAGNQALLSLTGSNQKINFTNPFDSDWLKFKAGDKTVDVTSGMQSTLTFLAKLAALPFENKKNLKENYHGAQSAEYAVKDLFSGEGRSIASPLGGTVWDVLSHKDFQGNVLPFYNDKPGVGRVRLSAFEYFMEKAPIPVSEGFRDVSEQMRQEGVSQPTVKQIMNGVLIAALGSTGVKIKNEPKKSRHH